MDPASDHPIVCPTEQALDLIASKWTVRIIYSLHGAEVLRFRELQRKIGAVTQKELTKQLRRLERFGLVRRRVFAEVPPRVEYRLTELGVTLVPALLTLSQWAAAYAQQVERSREAYDRQASGEVGVQAGPA